MPVDIELDTDKLLRDIGAAKAELSTYEERIIKVADNATKDVVLDLVDTIAGMAPESEPGEYNPDLGDHPPNTPLKESYYARRDESSDALIAWVPDTVEEMRTNILENGVVIPPFTAEHMTQYETEDGNTVSTLGKLAIPVESESEADEVIDGTPYIFRSSVSGGEITPKKFVESAVKLHDTETRLRQEINRRLRREFR